jgi:hypothetical protein
MGLENFVHKPLFALEVVIELALAGIRGADHIVGAGRAHALFVKEIRRHTYDLGFRIGSFG